MTVSGNEVNKNSGLGSFLDYIEKKSGNSADDDEEFIEGAYTNSY
jgi:hypothetical protein